MAYDSDVQKTDLLMNLLGLLYTAVDRNVRATDGEFIVEYM